MNTFFTLGEVSRRLAVPTHKLQYLLNSRAIDEPTRIAGRRVWTEADIERIANQLSCQSGKEVRNG